MTVRASVMFAACLVLGGCGHTSKHLYPEPERPAGELAKIVESKNEHGEWAQIYAVDDPEATHRIQGVRELLFGAAVGEAWVLPGRRQVTVSHHPSDQQGTASFCTLVLDAVAGRTYVVKHTSHKSRVLATFWIEDQQTGDLVSGPEPSGAGYREPADDVVDSEATLSQGPAPSCWVDSRESSRKVSDLIADGRHEDARLALDSWEASCGPLEPIYRVRLLSAIANGELYTRADFSKLIDRLTTYRFGVGEWVLYPSVAPQFSRSEYMNWDGQVNALHRSFNRVTRQWAERLRGDHPEDTFEHVLAAYYAGAFDSTYHKIKAIPPAWEMLAPHHERYVEETLGMWEYHFSSTIGGWIPLGDHDVLGSHPSAGLVIGLKPGKMMYDVTMAYRFGSSREDYLAGEGDQLVPSDSYLPWYHDLSIGRELFRSAHHELDLWIGGAYESRDETSDDADKAGIDNTFSASAGVGYRYYFRRYSGWKVGLQLRHHWVSYDTGGGTDLSGNALSVQFLVGLSGGDVRNRRLKYLDY